jgi:hypothetical protein
MELKIINSIFILFLISIGISLNSNLINNKIILKNIYLPNLLKNLLNQRKVNCLKVYKAHISYFNKQNKGYMML